jgi:hypothetical protein
MMARPRIRTKKRFNFPAPGLRPGLVDGSGFVFGFAFIFYLVKNQNHTEILKIRIRLTATRKPGKPDGLISMRRPTPTAIAVSTIPAANEINHAGK